jgi:hypothetical protein
VLDVAATIWLPEVPVLAPAAGDSCGEKANTIRRLHLSPWCAGDGLKTSAPWGGVAAALCLHADDPHKFVNRIDLPR